MRKYGFVLSVAGIALGLDHVAKWYVRRSVGLYESIVVLDSFFHITHVRNAGGAFSLFAGVSSTIRLPFFVLVSVAPATPLLFFVRGVVPQHPLLLFGLGAILGGALGNFVDRMT